MECSNKCCCCLRQYINAVVSGIGLRSFQAQLTMNPSLVLSPGDIVPFNDVLVPNPTIVTANPDGSFTVLKDGSYLVSYFVNIDGSEQVNTVFSVNGIPAQSNLTQGQLNGFAALTLAAGDTISLTSTNAGLVALGMNDIQAGIVITTV